MTLEQSRMSENDLLTRTPSRTPVAFNVPEMDMIRIYRENAAVFVSELLHHLDPQIGLIWRTVFEDLLGGDRAISSATTK